MLNDRFTRGLLAGIIAGILTKVYDLTAYYLHFSTLRWFDVAGTLIYDRKPFSFWEAFFATLGTWFFHTFLGVIFVYLIKKPLLSNNLILKGWFYGVAWWFIIFAVIILFKVPDISLVPLKTSLSNFVGASIWGLLLASALQWLDRKNNITLER